jgi:hypothetical protein
MWRDVHVFEDEDARRLERVPHLKELANDENLKLLSEELVYEYIGNLLLKKSREISRKHDLMLLLRFLKPFLRKKFLKEGDNYEHKFESYAKAAAEWLAIQNEIIKEAKEWLHFEGIEEDEIPKYLLSFARKIVQD